MHFCALVFIPEHGDATTQVSRRMAPFDENTSNPSWIEFQDCEKKQRSSWEKETVDLIATPQGEYLFPWDERFRIKDTIGIGRQTHRVPDDCQPVTKPLREIYPNFEDYLEKFCGLTRDEKTQKYGYWHNPNGHWDFYQIGGRWSGALDGYDPHEDPRNVTVCELCNGTGLRTDQVAVEHRKRDPNYKCNGCAGRGKHVRWPTQWRPHQGDVQQPAAVVAKGFIPYTLVTQEAKWLCREEWNDEKREFEETMEDWDGFVVQCLERHRGRVVLVDYHS